MNDKELIKTAKEAQCNAYAPYSKFQIGVALVGNNGRVYTGVNVENRSYGLTICAERNAVFKAVADGCTCFTKLVIFSSCSPPATPCGACRQVLAEFASDLEILCANDKDEINQYHLNKLLPDVFRLEKQ